MRRIMMGYAGELLFYYAPDGSPFTFDGLEIVSVWGPYTPRMELGKDYWVYA